MSDRRVTLFYYYGSYYSQKVLLTLFEKGCPFNRKIVNLAEGATKDPEFMRINPSGLVPALRDGPKVVIESEKIMDYIDKELKYGAQLIPDPATPVGKEVQRLRKLLDDIEIEVATYGIVFHPELSSDVKIPKFMLKKMKGLYKTQEAIDGLIKSAEKYPDLRDAYLQKAEVYRTQRGKVDNKDNVIRVLDDIEQKCNELENCLKKSKDSVSEGSEYWLTGSQFTAADVVLVVFIDRMNFLGLGERFFNKESRPLLNDFIQRIENRKSVQLLRAEFNKTKYAFLWLKVKSALPVVASLTTLGVAAGVGFWLLKKK